MKKPIACLWLLGVSTGLAEPLKLPDAVPGPFAPVPAAIAGLDAPKEPMEPTPPTLDGCKNAKAILSKLGIGLTDAQRTELAEQRFLLIPIEQTSICESLPEVEIENEWAFTTDEMLDAFDRLVGDPDISFRGQGQARLINPDLLLHAWHKGFSRALQHIEQRRLHAILTTFLDGCIKNTRELRAASKDEALSNRLAWTEARFAAPWVVLGPPAPPQLAPWEEEEKKTPPIPYAEAVANRLTAACKDLPEAPAAALREEVALILAAEGMGKSPLFSKYAPNKPADYTQFKPRSHYTTSDTLGGYFRAMMFLGRNGYGFNSSESYGDALLAALAMARTPSEGNAPLNEWKQLMEITGFFAGQSDDITYTELRKWVSETLGSDSLDPSIAISDETAAKLAAKLTDLRPPLIVSNAHTNEISSPDSEGPSFRIFGQRFTWDARVLDRFTRGSPQAMPSLPTALMVPAAFGDPLAEKLVRDGLSDNPTHLENFNTRLPEVRGELEGVTDEDWFASMAAKQLHVISSLTKPRGDTFPTYMKSDAYAAKNLESQLGSFTQLKHDTVLYAKQVYAEAGEGGFSDEKPPIVKGFIQPDLYFWREMERLAQFASDGFERHKLLEDSGEEFSRFKYFAHQIKQLRTIAEKQAAGAELTELEWETIRTISFMEMANPLIPFDMPKPGDGKNALVTDIATDAAGGNILFESLGRPLVMIALVGGKDGERMVAGVAYRYHEFSGPISKGRMTDEEWQEKIYIKDPAPSPRAPWQVALSKPVPSPSE